MSLEIVAFNQHASIPRGATIRGAIKTHHAFLHFVRFFRPSRPGRARVAHHIIPITSRRVIKGEMAKLAPWLTPVGSDEMPAREVGIWGAGAVTGPGTGARFSILAIRSMRY